MASSGANANPGDIIAGRYRIEGWVGQGGMGAVFRATHLFTKEVCALKLIHAHLVEHRHYMDMFVQEAQVGNRIGPNPYIVKVIDAGIDADRRVPFLAMEFLDGITLQEFVTQRGPVPAQLLKTLWLQLADALEQAHSAGVVHRDLKPANLFLVYDRKGTPQLRIVDFGIAKIMEQGAQRAATQIGTPAYAAPEQLGNGVRKLADRMGIQISSTISPATDIWSLGVMTYELLLGAGCGQLWTSSENQTDMDIMVFISTGPTPRASACAGLRSQLLPPHFDEWLNRCLQKNAAERWPNVELAINRLISLFDAPDEMREAAGSAAKNSVSRASPFANKRIRLEPVNLAVAQASASKPREQLASVIGAFETQSDEETSNEENRKISPFQSTATTAARIDQTNEGISETYAARRTDPRKFGVAMGLVIVSMLVFIVVAAIRFQQPKPTSNATVIALPSSSLESSNDAGPQDNTAIAAAPTDQVINTTRDSSASAAPNASAPQIHGMPRETTKKTEPTNDDQDVGTSKEPEGKAILSIDSTPVSRVIFDGKPLGKTPRIGLNVSAGEHTITFVTWENAKKTITVKVAPGQRRIIAEKID